LVLESQFRQIKSCACVRFGNFDGCIAAGGERLQLGCAAGSEWLRAAGDLGMTSIYSCPITLSVDHLRLRRKSPAAAKSEHCSQPREPLQNATIKSRGWSAMAAIETPSL
jgi:hypothetical protein